MTKPKTNDVDEEYQRLLADYQAARTAWETTSRDDPAFELAKRRFDNAQAALRESREFWRGVGEFTGDRRFVAITDNDGTAAEA